MIQNIQALRFVAAVWVLLHHMQAPITPFRFGLLPEAVSHMGFAGVDLFFVISGFIMAETTRGTASGGRPAMRFLLQRFGRIYIGWWPFFALYLAIQFGRLRPEISLPGSFFLWPQGLPQYLVPITWTLSFELYFYLGVTLLLLGCRKRAASLMVAAAIVIAASNAWAYQNGLYLPANEGAAKRSLLLPFYLSPLVLEFIAGFLLSEWLKRKPSAHLAPWLALALVLFGAAYGYQTHAGLHASGMAGFFHVNERAVLLGGFATSMVAVAVILERRGITAGRLMQHLGDASYCIYLTHITALHAAAKAYTRWQAQLELPDAAWAMGVTGLTLAFAWSFHRLYERPANLWLRKHLTHRL